MLNCELSIFFNSEYNSFMSFKKKYPNLNCNSQNMFLYFAIFYFIFITIFLLVPLSDPKFDCSMTFSFGKLFVSSNLHKIDYFNFVGNIVLFFPLAYSFAWVATATTKFSNQTFVRCFFTIFAVSVIFECTQYFLPYRVADFDDIFMNAYGAFCGTIANALVKLYFPRAFTVLPKIGLHPLS